MDEALTTPPTFQLNFSKQIYCIELSPYEWSQQLICVALAEEIVIGTVKFQVISLSFINEHPCVLNSMCLNYTRYIHCTRYIKLYVIK